MDRRGFLKGLLAAPVAGALIVRPEDAGAVELFNPKIEEPVFISRVTMDPPLSIAELGELVYDSRGNPLGIVTDVEVRTHPVDITHWNEDYRRYAPGLTEVMLRVQCSGVVSLEGIRKRR